MNLRPIAYALLVLAHASLSQQPTAPQLTAIAKLSRYAAENNSLGPPSTGTQRVVFFGDSITDNWGRNAGSFFPGKPYVNRGISGQTTSQMLLRFQQDVVHLQPAAVVLLAGTNDCAENTGPISDEQILDNIASMAAIARQNHIRFILASIPPADHFPWHPGIAPADRIRVLNNRLADYAAQQRLVFLNYYSVFAQPDGSMKPELAVDKAVHPNDAGYAVMQPLAESAIRAALAQPTP